jgi:hypothetical protein
MLQSPIGVAAFVMSTATRFGSSSFHRVLLGRGHHLDFRHHAPVLMLEDVTMIDELTQL